MSWTEYLGEVHLEPLPGTSITACCRVEISKLRETATVTSIPTEVTCPVSWSGRPVEPIALLEAALKHGKLEGSIERLLEIRARLVRASSSEINSGLRDELLRLIERGDH